MLSSPIRSEGVNWLDQQDQLGIDAEFLFDDHLDDQAVIRDHDLIDQRGGLTLSRMDQFLSVATSHQPPNSLWQELRVGVVLAIAVAVAVPYLASAYWLKTFTGVIIIALCSLSVAVLYVQLGMVSLCQYALFWRWRLDGAAPLSWLPHSVRDRLACRRHRRVRVRRDFRPAGAAQCAGFILRLSR